MPVRDFVPAASAREAHAVIDGQQRLTTSSLIAAALYAYGSLVTYAEVSANNLVASDTTVQDALKPLADMLAHNFDKKKIRDALRLTMRTDLSREHWSSLVRAVLTCQDSYASRGFGEHTFEEWLGQFTTAGRNGQPTAPTSNYGHYGAVVAGICRWLQEMVGAPRPLPKSHWDLLKGFRSYLTSNTKITNLNTNSEDVTLQVHIDDELMTINDAQCLTTLSMPLKPFFLQLFDAANAPGMPLDAHTVLKYKLSLAIAGAGSAGAGAAATAAHVQMPFEDWWNILEEDLLKWDHAKLKILEASNSDVKALLYSSLWCSLYCSHHS